MSNKSGFLSFILNLFSSVFSQKKLPVVNKGTTANNKEFVDVPHTNNPTNTSNSNSSFRDVNDGMG